MKRFFLSIALLSALTANAQQTLSVTVTNPMSVARNDQPVVIPLDNYPGTCSALVTSEGKEIASQLDDLDLDEQMDELCFLADLQGKETKTYQITLYNSGTPRSYPARVYAELLVRNTQDKKLQKNQHNKSPHAATVPTPTTCSTTTAWTSRANSTAYASTSTSDRR